MYGGVILTTMYEIQTNHNVVGQSLAHHKEGSPLYLS